MTVAKNAVSSEQIWFDEDICCNVRYRLLSILLFIFGGIKKIALDIEYAGLSYYDDLNIENINHFKWKKKINLVSPIWWQVNVYSLWLGIMLISNKCQRWEFYDQYWYCERKITFINHIFKWVSCRNWWRISYGFGEKWLKERIELPLQRESLEVSNKTLREQRADLLPYWFMYIVWFRGWRALVVL